MNKRTLLIGAAVAGVLMIMLIGVALSGDISEIGNGGMNDIPYTPGDDGLIDGSLPDMLFEKYGPVLLVLAILMFGAIIGGAYVAKEDDEDDSD
jgi:NADH:ubiquinone oxidoreductase subunit 6 (subunit J)